MTDSNALLADLEEASRIAKTGENMPLLGSSIGLMWGGGINNSDFLISISHT